MGFEYVYAYLENLSYAFIIITILSGLLLGFLMYLRLENEIDKDDWFYLMIYTTPVFFIFLCLTLSPGMAHIQEVRTKYNQTKETVNETYSSSYFDSVSGRVRGE